MFNRVILTFILLACGYNFIFCKSIADVEPHKDSYIILQQMNFTFHEQLEIIYHAEEARKLTPTNLTSIAVSLTDKIYSMPNTERIYCFVSTGAIHAKFTSNGKYIYLKSDIADNMHILCSRVPVGLTITHVI